MPRCFVNAVGVLFEDNSTGLALSTVSCTMLQLTDLHTSAKHIVDCSYSFTLLCIRSDMHTK